MMSVVPWALVGVAITAAGAMIWAIVALTWGVRHGQFRNMDKQARVIFDEVESEGTPTDFFPGKGPPPSEYLL